MEITQRAYRDPSDFEQISALMRAVSAHSPAWNAWSFARFDIWAARRLGDESVFHTTDWQSAIQLWHSADGGLLGAVLLRSAIIDVISALENRHTRFHPRQPRF